MNRVLFGTDMDVSAVIYSGWWRLLKSDDECMEGRMSWQIYGLHLSYDSLKTLYSDNALRILNRS